MAYIIKNPEGLYYREWADIGPRFTHDEKLAFQYTSREEALRATTTHHGFYTSDVIEIKGDDLT